MRLHSVRNIPKSYILLESVRMSVYKNLSTVSSEKDLDNILCGLIDRFGSAPTSLINIVNESRLRLLAARAGINSVVLRGCGVVCSSGIYDSVDYISSLIDFAGRFFEEEKIVYHVLPSVKNLFSLCVHFGEKIDSYYLFSRFFYKFNAVEKLTK